MTMASAAVQQPRTTGNGRGASRANGATVARANGRASANGNGSGSSSSGACTHPPADSVRPGTVA